MRRTEKHNPGVGVSLSGRVLTVLLGLVLATGLVPARGLAEAALDDGALEVVDGTGDGGALGVVEEDPVIAAAQYTEGSIGSAYYIIYEDGYLYVQAGGFTKAQWDDAVDEIGRSNVTSVEFAEVYVEGSASEMFDGFNRLVSVEARYFYVSNVTDMSSMFDGCSSLVSLEGLSSWDTSGVMDMSSMFNGCTSLKSLNLSGWNTCEVTDMSSMFNGCDSLDSLDLSGWDTYQVEDMSSMFNGCTSLESLNLSRWDTSGVTNMFAMFAACSKLATLDGVSDWCTWSLEYTSSMFYGCESLASLDLSRWDTSSVKDMSSMFCGCESLASLDVSRWKTGKVTSMSHMFSYCFKLPSHDLSGWNTREVMDMSYMFDSCTALESLNVSSWDTSSVTDMSRMFCGCSSLSSLVGISGWDTGSVTDMSGMFMSCENLSSFDGISDWKTGKVESMKAMFRGCSSLTSLDLSGWDMGSVTDMSYMFEVCLSLESLDVSGSGWNTGSVTDMSYMFEGCSSLTSLDLSSWNTGNVKSMHYMFQGCSSLTSLDLSGWNTGSVTHMPFMFQGCSSLTSLDLSGWETGNVKYMPYMFYGCSSLETVWVGADWDTQAVTSSNNMFNGCARLKGGAGTAYKDGNPKDKTYAHVDGGVDNPGYLSEGPVFRGCFLVLSGDIGVTFTLTAPKNFDVSGARVGFRVGGREVADAPLSGFETDEGGRYLLRCGVTSLEMAEDVVATLSWGEEPEKSVTASYSVEDYAHYVVENEGVYGDAAARLAKAINDYGYYAQLWLSGVHGFKLGDEGYAMMGAAYTTAYGYDTIKNRVDQAYKISKRLGDSGVKVSYQLHLDSATGLSVRVRPEPKDEVQIDGASLAGALQGKDGQRDAAVSGPLTKQEYYVVRLDGISAHRLADNLHVEGSTNKGGFSVDVCALSYVRTVFCTSEYADDTAAKDAMAALLEYYDATVNYRDSEGVTA